MKNFRFKSGIDAESLANS